MKKLLHLILISLLFSSGCGQSEQEYNHSPTIEGYIGNVENGSILVVSEITREQAINLSWEDFLKLKEGEENSEIIVFHRKNMFQDFSMFEKGQRIKVWGTTGLNESYPPQTDMGKFEFVE